MAMHDAEWTGSPQEIDGWGGMRWSCHFQSGNKYFKKLYEEMEEKH